MYNTGSYIPLLCGEFLVRIDLVPEPVPVVLSPPPCEELIGVQGKTKSVVISFRPRNFL